ncbi:serine-threonine rich protein [Stagonosporopsis vannaccii]|nr:serine-threonine rich protein [Stagonosporopsis vannaccii]
MKYINALPFIANLAAAQMQVMSLAPAAASGPATHTVVVGGLAPVATGMAPVLGYRPESITANVGDVVEFQFMQKNHTATQSTFAEPCKAMEGGKDSGFMPNPEGKEGVTWNMTVETTEAIWMYCKQAQGEHCGKGMVFSINAKLDGDKTMAQFKQLAIKSNGTTLQDSAIQSVDPAAAAAPSTVTVQAGGSAATGSGALASATVVPGQGTDGAGQTCTCSCLCGMNSFPASAAVNNFGGFAGMIG